MPWADLKIFSTLALATKILNIDYCAALFDAGNDNNLLEFKAVFNIVSVTIINTFIYMIASRECQSRIYHTLI